MLEDNPDEAVLNNVGGTRTVAEATLAADVDRFVNISTDKAVNLISMLGATKAIVELVVLEVSAGPGRQASSRCASATCLAARERGANLPRADPARRTGHGHRPGHDAVLHDDPRGVEAGVPGGIVSPNGAVYVLDMGTPVASPTWPEDMIRLSGRDEDEVDIVYTGLRPGEKLCEELFTEQERTSATRYEQILATPGTGPRERPPRTGRRPRRGREATRLGRDRRAPRRPMPGFHMRSSGHLQVTRL